MASLTSDGNDRWLIRWDNKRKRIRLKKRSRQEAEAFRRHVEHLIECFELGTPISRETQKWLAERRDGELSQLAYYGLCEKKTYESVEYLGGLLDLYIQDAEKRGCTPSSIESYRKVLQNLEDFFDRSRKIVWMTPEDADRFWDFLNKSANRVRQGGLAPSTATKRMEVCREIWSFAQKHGFVNNNIFAKQRHWKFVHSNPDKHVEVSAAVVRKIIAACPDHEFKFIVALSRWAGVRVPSEVLSLRWGDILWDSGAGKMWIHSQKTKRYAGKEKRLVPIFPEVRPHLQHLWDSAKEGEEKIIVRHRYYDKKTGMPRNVDYSERLKRYCHLAGVLPWVKPWTNMRSTRETELKNEFGLETACNWIGNTPKVAREHYLQVTEDEFLRASK